MPSLPHAGFSVRPSLGSYLESFRVYYMPDTVLVNTTNTTWEEMWALSWRRSLSRKKRKCIPQNKCNGRRGSISDGPKMERGLELALQKSIDTANVEKGNEVWLLTALKVWLVSEVETNRLDPQRVLLTSVSEIPKPSPFPNSLSQPTFTQFLD